MVLTDQQAARARVAELVDTAPGRRDGQATRLAVVNALVAAMDWTNGLVAGLTHQAIAAAAGTSVRTVSRVLAEARDAGLVAVVEGPASAAFLGTDHGRTPTYALLGPPPTLSTDLDGDPPRVAVERETPRRSRVDRLDEPWPLWDRAETTQDRGRATTTLLARIGVTGQVSTWRAAAMLAEWWTAGACVAGLLHALDHHPDRPTVGRGDAIAGARSPLAVMGHRLSPWRGRLDELPQSLHAVDRGERLARRRRLDALDDARPAHRGHVVTSSPEVRAAALAACRARTSRRDRPRVGR